MSKVIITIIALLTIITSACSDDAGIPPTNNTPIEQGDLNQPCYPNQTCNTDLICEEEICIASTPNTCGDSIIDVGEQCDGANLGSNTCIGIGFDSGELTCTADCKIETSTCVTYECGNDTLDPGEECDGETSLSCLDYGFSEDGEVTCGTNCLADTSACPAVCGDGIISGDEICENINDSAIFLDDSSIIPCQDWCDINRPGTEANGLTPHCYNCNDINYSNACRCY